MGCPNFIVDVNLIGATTWGLYCPWNSRAFVGLSGLEVLAGGGEGYLDSFGWSKHPMMSLAMSALLDRFSERRDVKSAVRRHQDFTSDISRETKRDCQGP